VWCLSARVAETVRWSWYLSLLERARVAALHGQGVSVGDIGRRLDHSASTISRGLSVTVELVPQQD
jgi:IS30 family transposase